MRVLVTGGAGYIGSHAAKALCQAGFEPLIFDNLSTGHKSFIGKNQFVEGDVCNPDDLDRAFRSGPVDGVLHFAGKALVEESHRDPAGYYRTNVIGGLTLLDAMKKHSVRRLIFSSTCATYGIPERTPISEDFTQRPVNPYGETKLAFERALQWYHKAGAIEFLALRYFNAAGADPEAAFGEDHDPESHLIPLIFEAALGRRSEVKIFGTDYPTPDGTCLRDYIHVDDLATAHVMGLRALMEGRIASQAINLGVGKGYSVREVIDVARAVTGRAFPVREAARRPGDPPALVASPARANQVLGWTAQNSGLEYIISTAWRWHQKLRAAV